MSFLYHLVFYIVMSFIIFASLIDFCVLKNPYDILKYCANFLNQAFLFLRAFLDSNVFFDFIKVEDVRSEYLVISNLK